MVVLRTGTTLEVVVRGARGLVGLLCVGNLGLLASFSFVRGDGRGCGSASFSDKKARGSAACAGWEKEGEGQRRRKGEREEGCGRSAKGG